MLYTGHAQADAVQNSWYIRRPANNRAMSLPYVGNTMAEADINRTTSLPYVGNTMAEADTPGDKNTTIKGTYV